MTISNKQRLIAQIGVLNDLSEILRSVKFDNLIAPHDISVSDVAAGAEGYLEWYNSDIGHTQDIVRAFAECLYDDDGTITTRLSWFSMYNSKINDPDQPSKESYGKIERILPNELVQAILELSQRQRKESQCQQEV